MLLFYFQAQEKTFISQNYFGNFYRVQHADYAKSFLFLMKKKHAIKLVSVWLGSAPRSDAVVNACLGVALSKCIENDYALSAFLNSPASVEQ